MMSTLTWQDQASSILQVFQKPCCPRTQSRDPQSLWPHLQSTLVTNRRMNWNMNTRGIAGFKFDWPYLRTCKCPCDRWRGRAMWGKVLGTRRCSRDTLWHGKGQTQTSRTSRYGTQSFTWNDGGQFFHLQALWSQPVKKMFSKLAKYFKML